MTTTNRRNFLKFGLGVAALPLIASAARAGGHATHVVEISGHAFSPATLKMEAGDKVTFINRDGAPHTATANNKSFNTGRLNRGDEVTVVIEKSARTAISAGFTGA